MKLLPKAKGKVLSSIINNPTSIDISKRKLRLIEEQTILLHKKKGIDYRLDFIAHQLNHLNEDKVYFMFTEV